MLNAQKFAEKANSKLVGSREREGGGGGCVQRQNHHFAKSHQTLSQFEEVAVMMVCYFFYKSFCI